MQLRLKVMAAHTDHNSITTVAVGNSELVKERIQTSAALMRELSEDMELMAKVGEVAQLICDALRRGRKMILFGNGGSAADAQHIAAELLGKYQHERRALAAIALTDNLSAVTAIANDYAFERVFSRQLEAIGGSGDIALAISTSGNSPNVLAAVKTARANAITTVALTGKSGGLLKSSVDYWLPVPSDSTPRVQECHILLGHVICEIVERNLS